MIAITFAHFPAVYPGSIGTLVGLYGVPEKLVERGGKRRATSWSFKWEVDLPHGNCVGI